VVIPSTNPLKEFSLNILMEGSQDFNFSNSKHCSWQTDFRTKKMQLGIHITFVPTAKYLKLKFSTTLLFKIIYALIFMILGIECTAHTFGIGIVDDGKILANIRDMFKTERGGIVPIEAAKHHREVAEQIYQKSLFLKSKNQNSSYINKFIIISYNTINI